MARRRRSSGYRRDMEAMDFLLDEEQREGGGRSRRRRKKRGGAFRLLLLLLFLCAIGLIAAGPFIERYIPSEERKDLNEWFEVSGDEVKIYFNDVGNNDIRAEARSGEVYLPLEWVHENISLRFYYSETEEMLSYALYDEILDFTAESVDEKGDPIFIFGDDKDPLISLSFIEQYQDVQDNRFISEDVSAKRVFIYHERGTVQNAEVSRDTELRTSSSIKAEILTDMKKGDTVTVMDSTEGWSRVVTSDGFIGYCRSNRLSESYEYTYRSDFEAEEPIYIMLEEKPVIGWHLVLNYSANDSVDELIADTEGHLNVICPTWIQINSADGGYNNYSSKEYVDKAHAAGIEVWAVVDNFNDPTGFSDFSTRDYFSTSDNRRDLISRLMEEAEAYGYDGFNLDFESLPSDAGESYAQFFRELAVACHKKGLKLSICNYVPYDYNAHYQLDEQGSFADYVIIMGYNEHDNSSEEAGSVASISYTGFGISKALENVDNDHLINAVPFYTRLWTETADGELSSRAMGMSEAMNYAETNDFEITWNEESGQYYAEKRYEDGNVQKIWLEEERSLSLKTELAKSYELAGTAAWRLGLGPSWAWQVLDMNEGS